MSEYDNSVLYDALDDIEHGVENLKDTMNNVRRLVTAEQEWQSYVDRLNARVWELEEFLEELGLNPEGSYSLWELSEIRKAIINITSLSTPLSG